MSLYQPEHKWPPQTFTKCSAHTFCTMQITILTFLLVFTFKFGTITIQTIQAVQCGFSQFTMKASRATISFPSKTAWHLTNFIINCFRLSLPGNKPSNPIFNQIQDRSNIHLVCPFKVLNYGTEQLSTTICTYVKYWLNSHS